MFGAGKERLMKWLLPVKKFVGRRYWHWTYAVVNPLCYNRYKKNAVNPRKVVFVEQRYRSLSDNFQGIYRALEQEGKYELHLHLLGEHDVGRGRFRKNCKAMLRDIATAGYVFFDDASKITGRVKIRPETTVTQVWHACGAFKKFGMSTSELKFGDNRKMTSRYPAYSNLDYVTVSSPEVVWAYREAMNLEQKKTRIVPTGVSRTDVFFQEENRKKAFEKLYQVMPKARGKRVILYAPTFRGAVGEARTMQLPGLSELKSRLSDSVIVIKHHPFVKKRPEIPKELQGSFALDVTDRMTIEELLFTADVCISDYSSLIFEYALFEKPMAFYVPDLEEYFDWRGFYYSFEELTPGPVLRTEEELREYLTHTEKWFDREQVRAFKEKFMSACDGHATERILELVFGSDRKKAKETLQED